MTKTSILKRMQNALHRQHSVPEKLDLIQDALGRIESRLNLNFHHANPADYEFKVSSQWGEDGIIDHLISRLDNIDRTFIEFGVETYIESNTRFLLKHRNWRGLVIDGSPDNIQTIKRSNNYWRYDLHAVSAFITRDNINEIIQQQGFDGKLGLLSVDIDGNDYWVWEAIDCVNPVIVICEYNSLFGPTASVTVPYRSDFARSSADSSNMYYGASISALAHLASRKGYKLVAGNSAGNNAFFVRTDVLGNLRSLEPHEAHVRAAFREAHTADGEVAHLTFDERQSAIAQHLVVDVLTGKQRVLKDVL